MQGSLLVMCLAWKVRQARLGMDDFGKPLGPDVPTVTVSSTEQNVSEDTALTPNQDLDAMNEHTPLLREQGTTGFNGKFRDFLSKVIGR